MTAVHAHLGHLSRIQTEMDEGKGPQASATLKGPPCGGGHRPIRRRRRLMCVGVPTRVHDIQRRTSGPRRRTDHGCASSPRRELPILPFFLVCGLVNVPRASCYHFPKTICETPRTTLGDRQGSGLSSPSSQLSIFWSAGIDA